MEPGGLYGRYAQLYDSGRADEFAALFTRDGAFLVDGAERARGRAAIATAARAGIAALPGVRHLISSIVVDVEADGETASGAAYVLALTAAEDALRFVTHGRYVDRFVIEDGCWRIARHDFEPFTGPALRGAPLVLPPPV